MASAGKFTIHFATINTALDENNVIIEGQFTIHFATINTVVYANIKCQLSVFTIHFATINTKPQFIQIKCYN